MSEWTRGEYIELSALFVSGFIAVGIYLLQRRLSDKQRVDNRLEIEKSVGKKIYDIRYKDHSSKVQLYNAKLLNKRYFSENRRSIVWGYPYHSAELYAANFDGLEFTVSIEEIEGRKYYKVGIIPYEHVLGIKPEGDTSFSGMIFFVKPRFFQKDRYSIAYRSFRFYPVNPKMAK